MVRAYTSALTLLGSVFLGVHILHRRGRATIFARGPVEVGFESLVHPLIDGRTFTVMDMLIMDRAPEIAAILALDPGQKESRLVFNPRVHDLAGRIIPHAPRARVDSDPVGSSID